jgi:hypothetical protein
VYPQSNLKGQHGFSWLLPSKKVKKGNAQEEQLRLLRQILAELQVLNANLASGKAAAQATTGPPGDNDDSGDEELEEYE